MKKVRVPVGAGLFIGRRIVWKDTCPRFKLEGEAAEMTSVTKRAASVQYTPYLVPCRDPMPGNLFDNQKFPPFLFHEARPFKTLRGGRNEISG